MLLLIDNYDSFSYNLVQLAGTLTPDILVERNDALTLSEIEELAPERIIISPGPGKPSDAGICEAAILRFAGRVPILGVCLGHQAICEALGATVGYARELVHGKPADIELDLTCDIFSALPGTITGARYHSLAVIESTLPPGLRVTARSRDGEVMAVAHESYRLYGLQFHPESVLTPLGGEILKNFIKGDVGA